VSVSVSVSVSVFRKYCAEQVRALRILRKTGPRLVPGVSVAGHTRALRVRRTARGEHADSRVLPRAAWHRCSAACATRRCSAACSGLGCLCVSAEWLRPVVGAGCDPDRPCVHTLVTLQLTDVQHISLSLSFSLSLSLSFSRNAWHQGTTTCGQARRRQLRRKHQMEFPLARQCCR
jgi:hypothetical protein